MNENHKVLRFAAWTLRQRIDDPINLALQRGIVIDFLGRDHLSGERIGSASILLKMIRPYLAQNSSVFAMDVHRTVIAAPVDHQHVFRWIDDRTDIGVRLDRGLL